MEKIELKKTSLDLEIVDRYIQQIKGQADNTISSWLADNNFQKIEYDKCSSVFDSWCVYSLKNSTMDFEKFESLVDLDLKTPQLCLAANVIDPNEFKYSEEQLGLFDDAIEIIEKTWNELWELVNIIRPRFYMPNPPKVGEHFPESSSDVKTFGQVHFTMERKTVSEWVEIISHEIAHHYLFVIYAAKHKKVKAPWKKVVYSDIRQSDRPLIGVMHAVVAESSMVYAAWKILESEDFKTHHSDSLCVLKRVGKNLLADFETCEQYNLFEIDKELEIFVRNSHLIAKKYLENK